MAYERYIKKNGKIYGPYIYHNVRKNGKVVSNYRGKKSSVKKENHFLKSSILPSIIFILLLFGIGYTTDFYFNDGEVFGGFTGLVVEDVADDSVEDAVVEE